MTRPNQPFINETSQAERREALANDRRASTYHQFTLPEEIPGGRYKQLEPRTIVGSNDPIPQYPAGAAWTRESSGDEMPLGFEIDAQEPTGERHEIEASFGNGLSPVANDATGFSAVASCEKPAPASHTPVGRRKGGSAPGTTVELSAQPNNFRRRI